MSIIFLLFTAQSKSTRKRKKSRNMQWIIGKWFAAPIFLQFDFMTLHLVICFIKYYYAHSTKLLFKYLVSFVRSFMFFFLVSLTCFLYSNATEMKKTTWRPPSSPMEWNTQAIWQTQWQWVLPNGYCMLWEKGLTILVTSNTFIALQ